MRIEGMFCPPSIGASTVPIPIAGEGHIELTDTELVVTGSAAGGMPVLMVLGTAVGATAGVLAVKYLLFPSMSASTVGAVIGASIVGSAFASRSARKDKPMELRIPWDKIKSAKLDQNNKDNVLIKVVKHKPKGMIHFRPGQDKDLLLAELQLRIG